MKRLIFALAAIVVAAAIAASVSPSPSSASLLPISHVVLIMEENTGSTKVTTTSMPFLVSQGTSFAHTTNYQNLTHPSLPNYMALTAGDDLFNGTDCSPSGSCVTPADNIFHQTAGAWKVWAQSAAHNCDTGNHGAYAVRHTAAPYFTDLLASGDNTCATNDIPMPATKTIGTNKFIFAVPDLNNDAHDGTLTQADTYLKGLVNGIKSRAYYQNGSTLIEVAFDESGKSGGNLLYTAFINPRFSHLVLKGTYNHYSLLKLNEDLLGLPELRNAATATDMRSELGL